MIATLHVADDLRSLLEAEKASKEVLSLPIHQDLTDEEIAYVITTIRQFFKK